MGFTGPRRRVACAVVVVAFASILTAGCGSHERVEVALAKAAIVSRSAGMTLSPTWSSPTQPPTVSAMPMTNASTYAPQRAMTTLSPAEQVAAKKLSTSQGSGDLRVMSFNLRVPFILDATNHWGFRKKNVIKTIQEYQPDVLGTQEVVAEQADYLREQLPEYGFRGVGRGDGDRQGEFAAVLYRRDKFKEIDHGYFWLSETPEKPGSKSWGAWSTRMCTWVKLQPLDGSPAFAIFNAHLDPFSRRSREMSCRLMHQRINSIAAGL